MRKFKVLIEKFEVSVIKIRALIILIKLLANSFPVV